jgi:serine/threonine protein phosphatase PrpC
MSVIFTCICVILIRCRNLKKLSNQHNGRHCNRTKLRVDSTRIREDSKRISLTFFFGAFSIEAATETKKLRAQKSLYCS